MRGNADHNKNTYNSNPGPNIRTTPAAPPSPDELERERLISSLRESPAFSAATGLYADPTDLVDWLHKYTTEQSRKAVEEFAAELKKETINYITDSGNTWPIVQVKHINQALERLRHDV